MQTIKNDRLTVNVSERGAEIRSIRRAGSDHEYIWQGDEKYWTGHAPLLFPSIGKSWQGKYRIDGRVMDMPKHGIVRGRDFAVTEATDTTLTFTLDADEQLLAIFPRRFRLSVTYRLEDARLYVEWRVTNTGRLALPFQIGAHPAFRYADWHEEDETHGYMTFSHVSDKLVSAALTSDGFLRPGESFDVALDADGRLPLQNDTFLCDTIIDCRRVIDAVTLHDKQGQPMLTVRYDMPVLALWSPCGGKAPFVCIEPWIGACDNAGYEGQFADRDVIHSLLPGETFTNIYSIEIA